MTENANSHQVDPGPSILRVATYNIHKGVQGMGPARRLEIHNLGHAVEQLDADIVCLQEVRKMNHKEAAYFERWPQVSQAEYLAPLGYEAVYRTNAYTRHGEHGNALLTRWPVVGHQHEDISDHRFEQRGLLHVEVEVQNRRVHTIVVHLGLIPAAACARSPSSSASSSERCRPARPWWWLATSTTGVARSSACWAVSACTSTTNCPACPPIPSRLPLAQLDHVYVRGLTPLGLHVPKGRIWWRMSDHLPLIAEFRL